MRQFCSRSLAHCGTSQCLAMNRVIEYIDPKMFGVPMPISFKKWCEHCKHVLKECVLSLFFYRQSQFPLVIYPILNGRFTPLPLANLFAAVFFPPIFSTSFLTPFGYLASGFKQSLFSSINGGFSI